MDRRVKPKMTDCSPCPRPAEPPSLLALPDAAILEVMRHLDGRSLVALERSASYFTRTDPVTLLPLGEHVARETLLQLAGTEAEAERFRRRSWSERLTLEQDAPAGFDRAHCEAAGFRFGFAPDASALRGVRLLGMGPKLLLSDASTATQPVLRWKLRVKGNTAVEFGVVPLALEPVHTALHKCLNVPDKPRERAMGFCSQITAGSLLPLKAPVMRGTILDVLARRGRLEVILRYPEDAKEISWHNGQPVHKPYRGPSELRLEQDFPADFDVRLAVTSWAKASFDVLHTGFPFDPAWAAECLSADAEDAAAGALSDASGAAAGDDAPAAAAAPLAAAAAAAAPEPEAGPFDAQPPLAAPEAPLAEPPLLPEVDALAEAAQGEPMQQDPAPAAPAAGPSTTPASPKGPTGPRASHAAAPAAGSPPGEAGPATPPPADPPQQAQQAPLPLWLRLAQGAAGAPPPPPLVVRRIPSRDGQMDSTPSSP